jgi:hypothetical protein
MYPMPGTAAASSVSVIRSSGYLLFYRELLFIFNAGPVNRKPVHGLNRRSHRQIITFSDYNVRSSTIYEENFLSDLLLAAGITGSAVLFFTVIFRSHS